MRLNLLDFAGSAPQANRRLGLRPGLVGDHQSHHQTSPGLSLVTDMQAIKVITPLQERINKERIAPLEDVGLMSFT